MKVVWKRILFWILIILIIWGNNGCRRKETNTVEDVAKKAKWQYEQEDFSAYVAQAANTFDVYQPSYIEQVTKELEKRKKAEAYSIDHPLFIQNPYGIMPNAIYMYMGEQDWKPYIYYTVRQLGVNIPEFNATFYIEEQENYLIEGQLVGLLEGVINEVNLIVCDEKGKVISDKNYVFDLRGEEIPKGLEQIILKKGTEKEEPTNGLFCCYLPLLEESNYCFYDNEGVLRTRIRAQEQVEYGKFLMAGNHIFYASAQNNLVLVDHKGQIIKQFSLRGKEEVQDYIYKEKSEEILLLTKDREDKNLFLYTISCEDGSLKLWYDFKNKERLNFILNNLKNGRVLMQEINENDVLLISSASGEIFRINYITTNPIVRWIMYNNAENLEEKAIALTGQKNMLPYYGMYGVYDYTKRKQPEGCFYLDVFAKTEDTAYFDRFYIDENRNEYKEKERFKLGEAEDILYAATYGNHIITSRGERLCEYNEDGNLLLSLKFQEGIARTVTKLTMSRYWF